MAKKIISLFLLCSAMFIASAQDSAPIAIRYATQDSVVTFASSLYQPNSFLRRLLMGTNYRKAWQVNVTLPVFFFSRSGFQIKELGGGMQTKSLHIIDSLGKEWALRTVDKDVSAAFSPGLRRTLIQKASQDFISAAFPYGAPVAGELVNAVGVHAARPQLVVVADDTALGPFRSLFANSICMLEERDPGFDSTDNIETTVANITQSSSYKIQQPLLLKARLLDMIMADWDRHADNWRWGLKDSAGLNYYYAIPRDRDWAFFQSKGLLPKLVQFSGGMRCFINFSPDVKNIKNLSWKAWTLDKNFLNEMDAAAWETAIQEVQTMLTDSIIEEAVKKMPASVYAMQGENFISTLKSRRDELKDGAMKYYNFLSEEVVINGSNEEEIFSVSSAGDRLFVVVHRMGGVKQKIYERSFPPSETYFITLNGLGGNDVFEIDENAQSKIRLIINGGKGADRYSIKGNVRTKVNDTASENNSIENGGQATIHLE